MVRCVSVTPRHLLVVVVVVVLATVLPSCRSSNVTSSESQNFTQASRQLLNDFNRQDIKACRDASLASWNFMTNMTEHNRILLLKEKKKQAALLKQRWTRVKNVDWSKLTNKPMKRGFQFMSKPYRAILPAAELKTMNDLDTQMKKEYGSAKVCSVGAKNCTLSLKPDLTELMASSRDAEQLQHLWVGWRNATGRKIRSRFLEYVQLIDKVAKKNGFADASDMWLEEYESADFKTQVALLWDQLAPLYEQLHAYVRTRLQQVYGVNLVPDKAPIPAHLLGDMWAQSWTNIADLVKPYPQHASIDVTAEMQNQSYTPQRMFRLAEQFGESLGLPPMSPTFWSKSVLEKPRDGRQLLCQASAADMCIRDDFRLKMCTEVNMKDLITVHHEMGHIHYFMETRLLPVVFRRGANPGFHEAVGDTFALSAMTPKHLKAIGLFNGSVSDPKVNMNFLMHTALDKIAFLPFSYLVDMWRWQVFSGETRSQHLNCEWWRLRQNIQGVSSPVVRSKLDFDAGSKFHVAANVPYLRYFVSTILQFQFHKALCIAAGQYKPGNRSTPLHQCDIAGSIDAGRKLSKMMGAGFSKKWPDVLQAMTGQRNMDASALREYFQPLEDWLKRENRERGTSVGWTKTGRMCGRKATHHHAHHRAASITITPQPLITLLLCAALLLYPSAC